MSYINLPPGRLRRLTYSQELNYIPSLQPLSRQEILNNIDVESNGNFGWGNEFYITSTEDLARQGSGLISKRLLKNSYIQSNTKIDFCCICHDDINMNDIIRQLICNHIFHVNCIDKWFVNKSTCPKCRKEI
jgi:hypothetical protein